MRLREIGLAATLTLVLGMMAAPAAAQVATTSIEGVVTDSTGAVLPGVSVEVRNAATNLTRNLVTDADGRFAALQLPPGKYTVTWKLTGFATVTLDNVEATVGNSVHLTPSLKVAGVTEMVVDRITPG